ncbi:hypothetical protein [Desulfotruncus arcticus]|uniref:hypothetical protein n=1 Tax=Desulfotruncus arcticus TaxID=341036 RepID=UPI0013F4CF73|nr:hypothetical protein [Desulfotruncus arcticus]
MATIVEFAEEINNANDVMVKITYFRFLFKKVLFDMIIYTPDEKSIKYAKNGLDVSCIFYGKIIFFVGFGQFHVKIALAVKNRSAS